MAEAVFRLCLKYLLILKRYTEKSSEQEIYSLLKITFGHYIMENFLFVDTERPAILRVSETKEY